MAEIELRKLSKSFDGAGAVTETSLCIRDGELFVLVGPSGCGKSTLLNLIVGLEQPSGGEILLDGQRIEGVDPKDRNMAMVFQSYALYPHMSVRENLAFPLKLAKLSRAEIEERVQRAARTLELSDLLGRKPAALSGGQRQRVAMGRALVREPRVFLLDEPLSNLDAKLRGQMRAEIARLQRRLGTTMVYVTHDQIEAMTLGDRIAVLRRGEVQQVGTPRELYERPANLFVAGFIGSPAMNFLPARLSADRLELPIGALRLPEGLRTARDRPEGSLVAGFRPEHLTTGEGEVPVVEAEVQLVEWLGADLFVHLEVPIEGFGECALPEDLGLSPSVDGRRRLVARLDPATPVREGDRLRLQLPPGCLQLFDPQSGKRLTP